ncbi:MAG: sigma-70 family RNA polymerase sigma factor [bacterium]|nr:sigma-70 family RNA polymerase sigma factor [bacterium]
MTVPTARNDESLAADSSAGNEKALELLIARYVSPVYNYALRFSGNGDDAEDITQEVFLKLWKNVGRFNAEGRFKPWLFRIAHNVAIDHVRKRRTLPFSFFDREEGNALAETLPDTDPLPDELFRRKESEDALGVALDKISTLSREVLVLHYHHELTFDEVGQILGKSLNTVKSQHRRALFALRREFLLDNDAPI